MPQLCHPAPHTVTTPDAMAYGQGSLPVPTPFSYSWSQRGVKEAGVPDRAEDAGPTGGVRGGMSLSRVRRHD